MRRARQAVIEKQSRIQVVSEVDQEAIVSLAHVVELLLGFELLVLLAAALAPRTRSIMRSARHAHHVRDRGQCFVASCAHRVLGNRRRRRVFLHADPALVSLP